MTINFPSPATLNQIYSSPPQQWLFDGEKWTALNSQGSLSLYLPLTGGALASPGNLSVGGTLGVTGNTTLTGTLGVTGATTLGNASLSGTLSVTGNTTLAIATATTPATADNSTRIATTNYVQAQGYATSASVSAGYLPLSGGTITNNLTVNNQLSVYGGTFYNGYSNGWCYFNGSLRVYDFISNNNVNAQGSLYCGGCQIYNNGGWTYSPNNFRSPSLYADNGNVYAQNAVYVNYNSGLYWSNNGGWMYCPVGVWCSNINTGSIQCNGANINGVNIAYCSQSGIGGYGSVQYGWANGNWFAFQCSDAIYFYVNQGYAGGVYYSFCDARMKWNFGSVERDCLAAINAVELRKFDFSEGPAPNRRINPHETQPDLFRWENLPRKVKHIETGFVAQQLRQIIPEAVPEPEDGAFLSVDMRPLVATLIGAVQQLSAEVATLKARNAYDGL